MTEDEPTDDDSIDSRTLRGVLGTFASVSMPSPLHLLRAGMKGLDAAFDLVQYALEADEEATVEALKNHDDPIDTLTTLAKIVRDGEGP